MKILFLTDTHIRGNSPKNRLDNFPETIEKKLMEITQIIEKYNVDFLLHGGDLFDRPDVSISIMNKFAPIFNQIKIPVYIICGNHDIFGHNPNTVNRTMLGLLNALNIMKIINPNDKIYLEKNNIKVQLTGQPYTYDIDNTNDKSPYILNEISPNVDYAIHMVHGLLLNKPFIKGIPYTLIDDIKDTKAHITLAGHYHTGFGIINTNEKYFINPGSLVRITNSLAEIDRTPKAALIELNEKINIELIPLKSAVKGENILDRREIENSIFKSEKLFEFKQSIDTAINFDKLDINDILIEVSNTKNVSEEVKQEALRRIANSQMKDLEGRI
ncbi:MAG: metallophosphoesterase [Tissierellia bacterium]|nr:metallophosphoesterase [Tissierellia bacterium]